MADQIKHFNKGIVFGRFSSFKIVTGKNRRMNIILECPNSMHGDPRIFATAFGAMVDRLQDVLLTKGKGAALRLQGIYGQYEHDGSRTSSFTVYDWITYNESEYRAVFILIGRVEQIEKDGDEWRVHLRLSRPGGKDKDNIEEDFILYADNIGQLSQGQTAKLKGVIARKEDYFGDSEGSFKPYIKEISILAPETEGPF